MGYVNSRHHWFRHLVKYSGFEEVKVSQQGKNFIEFFEGRRHEAYKDTANIYTIGVGHVKGVKPYMMATDTQIDKWLEEDLAEATKKIEPHIKREMTQAEQDALISQAFNMTTNSAIKLAKYFEKDKELWKVKTLLYTNDVAGNAVKGLNIRRISERLLAEERDWKTFATWAQRKTTNIGMILQKKNELFGGIKDP